MSRLPSPRRIGFDIALVAITALLVTQVVAAAPAAKVATAYWSDGGGELQTDFTILDQMDVPAGKYHVIATISLTNRIPNETPGAYINKVYCSLFAHGINTAAITTLGAGEFTTMTLQLVIDASRAPLTAFIDVECKAEGATAPLPLAGVTIVANALSGIVDLRQQ